MSATPEQLKHTSDVDRVNWAKETLTNSSSTGSYSEDAYKKNSGRLQQEQFESKVRERNASYREGLECLQGCERKSFDIGDITRYARARRAAERLLEPELFDARRSFARRRRFVRNQRCISHITHKILGDPDRKERRVARKAGCPLPRTRCVVFFGRATFSGIKGHVVVARKKLIRSLARESLVVLVDEHNTSKLCPLDYQELVDALLTTTSEKRERLRQCSNCQYGPFVCDRDLIGGCNIVQKAFYQLCGRRLEALYPQH